MNCVDSILPEIRRTPEGTRTDMENRIGIRWKINFVFDNTQCHPLDGEQSGFIRQDSMMV